MRVDQVHRLLQGLHPHDAQHRAKDFLLVNHHARFDVVKQAGAQKVAVLMAGHLDAAAVYQQGGALGDALVDVALDLFKMRLADQRTHVVAGVGARAHLHLGDFGFQAGDHGVGGGVAHGHDQRHCHAALTAGAVGRAHHGADGIGHVGIRHHHGVVLGAAQRLHPLACGAAGGVHVLGNRRGADKAHGFHARVGQQGVHRFLVALHHIEHARWQAGLQRQLGHAQRAAWVSLGRFQDEGVAAGHRHGPHPQRHHDGEVERRDASGDTQRLKLAPRVDGRPHVFAVLALEQLGGVAGVLHVLDAALQLAQRIGQYLAVLGRDQGAQLIGMLLQQHFQVAHDTGALERRRGAPGRVSGLRAGNRLLDGSFVGQQHTLFGAAGGWVEHVLRAAAAGNPLAVDQVGNGGESGHRE